MRLLFFLLILLSSCSNHEKEKSIPETIEEPKVQISSPEIDTAFLAQVKNAWAFKQLLPANSQNEIKEVLLEFRFTNDTIADYLIVSRLDRYATGVIVDGYTGKQLWGDTLNAFEPENMFWTRPGDDGLRFNLVNERDKNQHDLEVYHTWKLENSSVTDYYIYQYDETTNSVKMTVKKNLLDEEVGRLD